MLYVRQILETKKSNNYSLYNKSMKLVTGIGYGTRSNYRYSPAYKMSNNRCSIIIINYSCVAENWIKSTKKLTTKVSFVIFLNF